jgi:predicted phage baseplate assembly protein
MNDQSETCGACCSGSNNNPLPGQDTLRVRIGTPADFFAAMTDRLSQERLGGVDLSALKGLTTRSLTDPSIAWLDAAAVVADILAFYQERIANEGYLHTATEKLSVTELARLVGYAPRPGVSASCYLAYTLEINSKSVIPKRTRAASTPAQGQLPQVFETDEPCSGRAEWNALQPRLSRPQVILSQDARNVVTIYLAGDSLNVKPGDLLLLAFPDSNPQPRRVETVEVDHTARRTTVTLQVDALSTLRTILDARQALAKYQADSSLDAATLASPELAPVVSADKSAQDKIKEATANGGALADVDEKLTDALSLITAIKTAAGSLVQLNIDARGLVNTLFSEVQAAQIEAIAIPLLNSQFTALKDWYTQQNALLAALEIELNNPTPGAGAAAPLTAAAQAAKTALDPLIALNGLATNPPSPKELTDATGSLESTLTSLIAKTLTTQTDRDDFVNDFDQAKSDFLNAKLTDSAPATNGEGQLNDVSTHLSASADLKAKVDALDQGLTDLDLLIASPPTGKVGLLARLKQLRSNLSQTDGMRTKVIEASKNFRTNSSTKITPLVVAVLGLIDGLLNQLKTLTTVTASVKAMKDFQDDLGTKRTTGEPPNPIAVGAEVFQKAAIFLLGSLQDILWTARQTFLREFAQSQARFLRLRDVKPAPDSTAKAAIDALDQLGQVLNTLLPEIHPTPDKYPDSTLKVVLAKINSVMDPLHLTTGVMREDAQRFFAALEVDLDTTRLQITGESASSGDPNSPPSNELAGLFDVSRKLTGTQRTSVGRPTLNPNLILGVPDGNSASDSQTAVDAIPRFLQSINPDQTTALFNAWRGRRFGENEVRVFGFRQKTQLFGYNAPQFLPAADPTKPPVANNQFVVDEFASRLFLSEGYDSVLPGSYVVVETSPSDSPQAILILKVTVHPRTAYGLSAKTTEIDLDQGRTWRSTDPTAAAASFNLLRTTAVYVQAEQFDLAEVPLAQSIGDTPKTNDVDPFLSQPREIELDDLYDGIEIGRTVVVEGEVVNLPGVKLAEPASIASVTHIRRPVFGDTPHTRIALAQDLTQIYKRDTVVVYGNVVSASHGETHREVLGSGNGTAYQQFTLKFRPLTHLAAPTPDGAEPALEVRVNDVLWTRGRELSEFGPGDRGYAIRIDEDQTANVIFGDGVHGARPPTGVDNIRAVYRNGLGAAGNLGARQIDQAMDRPLGVKAVINPFPSSGGADRETRDQARANAPVGSKALERVVSVSDYADFARTFAGIGKASAARMPGAWHSLVHVTVAGPDPTPVREESDLFRNLLQAFNDLGDGTQGVFLQPCRRVLLVVIATVRIADDYLFESVEPRIRQLLLDRFGYEQRDLMQGVTASEILAAIHSIEGVAYADLSALGSVREFRTQDDITQQLRNVTNQRNAGRRSLRWVAASPAIYSPGETPPYKAAEIAYLDEYRPETLLISEVQ